MKHIKFKLELFRQILMSRINRYPLLLNIKLTVKYHFQFKKRLTRQLKQRVGAKNVFRHQQAKRIIILLIETSHYQIFQLLILGKALEQRGMRIDILVCDEILDACEIKSVKNATHKDNCVKCRFNRTHLLPQFGFNVISLSSLIGPDEYIQANNLASELANKPSAEWMYENFSLRNIIDDSVTRYYYGGSPPNDVEGHEIRRSNLFSSILGFIAAKNLELEYQPDIILNSMNAYSAWEPYYRYFNNRGNTKISTINITQFNYNSVIFNTNELYQSNERYFKYFNSRENSTLNNHENAVLDNFMTQRRSGESKIFKDLGFFNNLTTNNIPNTRKRKNIVLFSNIFWDIGLSECASLYASVIEWVMDTIYILKESDDIDLFIKIHPGEVFDTAKSIKGVEDYINDEYPILPENVFLIRPQDQVNPYSLFSKIDLGIVFNGTLGLEMLLDNIPVVITGQAPYSNLNLVMEPKTRKEYESMLLDKHIYYKPDTNKIRTFAYFYFIKSCIPWTLTESAYSDNFKGYSIKTLNDLNPGVNTHLDHLCNCIIHDDIVIENW
jgi:hypothetical protein